VQALGGQWGRLASEEKLNYFERALYLVHQKPDESHDSYLARHDAAFEDLISQKVSLEEVRAYILLRQSLLTPDERKRIIMEKGGNLNYDDARQQIRLLGSRFFQELQSGSGGRASKLKTYDINHVDEETALWHDDEDEDEDTFIHTLAENGDEDACFVADFEEQILVACQESSQLAACFTTYQEARFRLKEKARNRGFWPPSANKGRGRGKGYGGKGKGSSAGEKGASWSTGGNMFSRRKTLADRIANSNCRKCGRPGHWKRECPLGLGMVATTPVKKPENENFTGLMIDDFEVYTENVYSAITGDDLVTELPPGAEVLEVSEVNGVMVDHGVCHVEHVNMGDVGFVNQRGPKDADLTTNLVHRLVPCCRSIRCINLKTALPTANSEPACRESTFLPGHSDHEAGGTCIFNVEEADDEAIIDTGASKAVIGKERLSRLLKSLPKGIRSGVMRVPTNGVVFKFGNAGRLASEFAVLLPRSKNDWLRVEVVPGQTPFLISNSVLGSLRGVVDVFGKKLCFREHSEEIPLFEVRRSLLGVKVLDLLTKTPTCSERTPTHIYCAHELKRETETDQGKTQTKMETNHKSSPVPQHDMHHNNMGGIQSFDHGSPKETQTFLLHDNSKKNARAFSELNYQEHTTGGILPEERVNSQGNVFAGAVSAADADLTGGSKSPESTAAPRDALGADSSARSGESGGVGKAAHTLRETPREDLCRDLRERQGLHTPNVESEGSVVMDTQLPAVLSPSPGEEHRKSGTGDKGTGIADADLATYDTGSPGVDCGRGSTMALSTHQCQAHCRQGQVEEHSTTSNSQIRDQGGVRVAEDRSRGEDQQAWVSDIQHAIDGDSAQRGSSERADHEDSGVATRIATGDPGKAPSRGRCLKLLSTEEMLLIQQSVETLTNQIELDLQGLKRDRQYVDNKGSPKTKLQHVPKYLGPRVDLLEVYCDEGSQLTRVCNQKGGRALRFTREHGDLSTEEGVTKLWTWIELYEPKHVWVAPECCLWGNYSRYNMNRSMENFERIQGERQSDRHHLELCNQIYLHQISKGNHFHLEQPRGSEMILQPELQDVRLGTLPMTFDMCQVGQLQMPRTSEFLQKRTQVHTTSRKLFDSFHQNYCQGNHEHQPIKGKFQHNGKWIAISAYAQAYTSQFARRIMQTLLRNPGEQPLLVEEMILGLEHERPELAHESLQLQKRRRVELKQPESSLYGKAPAWKDVFRQAGYETPRVGGHRFEEGTVLVKLIQQLVPEFSVKR